MSCSVRHSCGHVLDRDSVSSVNMLVTWRLWRGLPSLKRLLPCLSFRVQWKIIAVSLIHQEGQVLSCTVQGVSTPKGQWLTSVYAVDVLWLIVVHMRSSKQRLVNVCLLRSACALSQICKCMYFLSVLKNDGTQKPLHSIDLRDYTLIRHTHISYWPSESHPSLHSSHTDCDTHGIRGISGQSAV